MCHCGMFLEDWGRILYISSFHRRGAFRKVSTRSRQCQTLFVTGPQGYLRDEWPIWVGGCRSGHYTLNDTTKDLNLMRIVVRDKEGDRLGMCAVALSCILNPVHKFSSCLLMKDYYCVIVIIVVVIRHFTVRLYLSTSIKVVGKESHWFYCVHQNRTTNKRIIITLI